MDDFYVTVMSNSSQDIYPDNTSSKFTIKLPKPLNLSNHMVALEEIFHSPIYGVLTAPDSNDDIIIFPFTFSNEINQKEPEHTYDLNGLVSKIIENAKHAKTYTRGYFFQYLDKRLLKEWEICPELSADKTVIDVPDNEYHSSVIKVTTFTPSLKYRDSVDKEEKFIQFQKGRVYTGRQVLWLILNHYYELFTSSISDEELLDRYGISRKNQTVADFLYFYSLSFVNTLRELTQQHRTIESSYILLYTDIIENSMVGRDFASLLFLTKRNRYYENHNIIVFHPKFLRCQKKEIDQISFFFADELGRPIKFQGGREPCVLVLHFKSV